jgi:hypothetical protein
MVAYDPNADAVSVYKRLCGKKGPKREIIRGRFLRKINQGRDSLIGQK